MSFEKFLALAAGGVTGTFARYFLSTAIHQTWGTRFPLGTLLVNLLGCFAAGAVIGWGEEKVVLNPELKLLLITGFCGAFTTFSALVLESETLLKSGSAGYAGLHLLLNIVLGFLLFRAGFRLGEIF